MISVTVKRRGTLVSKYANMLLRNGKKVEKGLYASAEVLLEESLKLVPRDTEALAESAEIIKRGSGLDTQVAVQYGSKDSPVKMDVWSEKEGKFVDRDPFTYAIIVHERMDIYHDPPTQANFLREPSLTKQAEMRVAFNSAAGRVFPIQIATPFQVNPNE